MNLLSYIFILPKPTYLWNENVLMKMRGERLLFTDWRSYKWDRIVWSWFVFPLFFSKQPDWLEILNIYDVLKVNFFIQLSKLWSSVYFQNQSLVIQWLRKHSSQYKLLNAQAWYVNKMRNEQTCACFVIESASSKITILKGGQLVPLK